jgi:hypothetical protein
MIAIGDPRQADAVMVGEAMPPLRQYFPPLLKGRDAHVRTQTSAIPAPLIFGLIVQYAAIRRGRRGCDSRHSSQPVGEGHAPVVAVLLSRAKADVRMAVLKGRGR